LALGEELEPRILFSGGTTYLVNTLADTVADDGLLSVREAVMAADTNQAVHEAPAGSNTEQDVIEFDPGLYGGTIVLSLGMLSITDDLRIIGPGSDKLTIDADRRSAIFNINAPGSGSYAADVRISGLTLRQGGSSAIRATSNHTLVFMDLILSECSGSSAGAMVLSGGGKAYVVDSRFTDNHTAHNGGAIRTQIQNAYIINSFFSGNSASYYGDDIYRYWRSGMDVQAHFCTFVSSEADSFYIDDGSAVIANSIVGGRLTGAVSEPLRTKSGSFDIRNSFIGVNPGFADPSSGDYRLSSESPAIDAGIYSLLPADQADIDGDGDLTEPIPMTADGVSRAINGYLDIGAFEYDGDPRYVEDGPLVVTTTEDLVSPDDGRTSLREAIFSAQHGPTENPTVTFSPALADQTITLDGLPLALTKSLTIDAGAVGQVTIDAAGASRVLSILGPETVATLRNLTITGGKGVGNGAGICVQNGSLDFEGGFIMGNELSRTGGYTGHLRGAGIHCYNGTVTVSRSTIRDNLIETHNTYRESAQGAGISLLEGTGNIGNSIISGNSAYGAYGYGGGIYNSGTLTLTNTTVSGNTAGDYAGGIYNLSGALTLENTIVALNNDSFASGADVYGAFTNQNQSSLIGVVPGFVRNPSPGVDSRWGTADDDHGDLHLTEGSFAVDAGDDSLAALPTDGDGNPRIVNERVDIGAYEYQAAQSPREAPSTVVTVLQYDDVDVTDEETSLAEALFYSQRDDTPDVVTFDGSLAGGTIMLTGWQMTISHDIMIDASLIGGITIDANDMSRVFCIKGSETDVSLVNLTVTGGNARSGGGIYNSSGALTLTSTTVNGNTADEGGGIYNSGTLTLEDNTTVSGNTATGGISSGRGGGIYNHYGALALTSTTVNGNTARYGGGIYNYITAIARTLTLENTTVSGNTAGDYGGGIYNSSGTLELTNTTVSGNTADYGGGIYNSSGTLELTNATVSGNTAGHYGGGICNPYSTLTLKNTIVALNGAPSDADIRGAFTAQCSLVGEDPGFVRNPAPGADSVWGTADDDYGDLRLLSTSPAVDAGCNWLLPPDTFDLAGNPRIYDGTVDIGAYEFQGATPPRVADFLVSSSAWSGDFLDYLSAHGLGDGGYSIPVGSAAQLAPLPWSDIDRIKIVFSQDVSVAMSNLSIFGVNAPSGVVSGFVYDGARRTGIWTLSEPLAADKLLAVLYDDVTDAAGNALDGEWNDESSVFRSGDAAAGGDFQFRLNILPGDTDSDGAVGDIDYETFMDEFGVRQTSLTSDFNCDNRVSLADFAIIRSALGSTLPSGEPTPPEAPPVAQQYQGDSLAGGAAADPASSESTPDRLLELPGVDISGPQPVIASSPAPALYSYEAIDREPGDDLLTDHANDPGDSLGVSIGADGLLTDILAESPLVVSL
jgi:hypothetical protein